MDNMRRCWNQTAEEMLREAKSGSKRNSDHGTREYLAMRMAIQCKIITKKKKKKRKKEKRQKGDIEI